MIIHSEIYTLLAIFIAMFPLVYLVCKGNIGKPIFIMWVSSVISILCACYQGSVNGFTISFRTVTLITVGFLCCIVGSCVADIKKITVCKSNVDELYFNLSNTKCIIILLFFVLETIVIIKYTHSISGINGGSISEIAGNYSKIVNSDEDSMPFWLRELFRFGRIAIYYFIYILISQYVNKIKNSKNFVFIICIFLFLVQKIYTGSRSDILYMLFSAIVFYLIEYRRCFGNKEIPMKAIIKVVLACMAVFAFFGISKSMFGKTSQASVFDYLTFYMGNSIYSLDYRSIRFDDHSYILANTFRGVWRCLKSYLGVDVRIISLPSTYINGKYNGNTYTMFYRFFADMGYGGIVIFSCYFSYLFTKVYNRICGEKSGSTHRMREVLYAYLAEALFLVLYDEHFFSMRISFGLVTDLIWLLLVDWIVNLQIKHFKITLNKRLY